MNVLGDPLFNLLGPVAGDTENPESLEKIDAAKAEYHLDDPLPVRYVKWLGDFVTGDFGVQFSTDGEPPVSDLIKERVPRTIMLLVMAQTLALVISIPWALWAASKADKPVDRVSTLARSMLIAVPSFALGVILKYLFAIKLGWFPQRYVATDHPGRAGRVDGPAGVDARLSGRRRLPTAAPHRPDHDPPGGLHPDGAQQGRVATSRAVQARAAALACSRSSPCSGSTPAP